MSAVARAGRPDLVHNSVSGIVLCYDVGVIEVRHQVDPTRQILVSSNSPTQESEFFQALRHHFLVSPVARFAVCLDCRHGFC